MRSPALLAVALGLLVTQSASAASPIAGRYLTADASGIVQVGPCGSAVCGKLVKILKARPGAATTDVNNADPALRGRPILGMPILSGFADRGDDWRGTIYDPRNGKTYRSIVSRDPDGSLKVQGCIAVFCQTQRWPPAP